MLCGISTRSMIDRLILLALGSASIEAGSSKQYLPRQFSCIKVTWQADYVNHAETFAWRLANCHSVSSKIIFRVWTCKIMLLIANCRFGNEKSSNITLRSSQLSLQVPRITAQIFVRTFEEEMKFVLFACITFAQYYITKCTRVHMIFYTKCEFEQPNEHKANESPAK